jgi:hypothetical protein
MGGLVWFLDRPFHILNEEFVMLYRRADRLCKGDQIKVGEWWCTVQAVCRDSISGPDVYIFDVSYIPVHSWTQVKSQINRFCDDMLRVKDGNTI